MIRFSDSAPSPNDNLGEAWSGFLGRWPWDLFATLTFRGDAVHPESADKRYRVWISKINRSLYGTRWFKHGKGIRWVRALEHQRRGIVHFHALLGGERVKELRRLTLMDEWFDLAGIARIETPRNSEAVRAYCAKYVVKGGEIDFGGPPSPPTVLDLWPGSLPTSPGGDQPARPRTRGPPK